MKFLKCIKLNHFNWQIVGVLSGIWQTGSPAVRQTGSPADRQSGRLANWQVGRSALGLVALIFTLFCIVPSVSKAQSDSTAVVDTCSSENCGAAPAITTAAEGVADAVSVDNKNCPENVQAVRRLMALSYGSCAVLDHPQWRTKENNGILVHGYTYQPGCSYSKDRQEACTKIDDYNEIMETHPYNSAEKTNACTADAQCSIDGENKTCPVLFAMAGESYAYKDQSNDEIDIFKHKTKDFSSDNRFLGWNCSEYVTTAMALAGYRLVKKDSGICGGLPSEKIGKSNQGYSAEMYVNLTGHSCSCLTSVDLTSPKDPTKPTELNSIQPGDLIYTDGNPGHIMIVEAVGDPFFRDATENVNECDEENIYTDHLQVRVNHSSSTMGGPGSTQFSEHQRFNYQQSLSYAVGGYIDTCEASAGDDEEKEACWTDEDQEEYTDYFYFFKRLGLDGGSETPGDDWYKKGKDDENESGNIWPEGSSYPLWPTTRKYLSAVCKARWYKQKNEAVPDEVTEVLDTMNDSSLKVIRHKHETDEDKAACTDQDEDERPKLKNEECLGDCVEGDKICAQY